MEDISLLEERLKNGGFEGIESVVHKTPFGPWAKDKRLQKAGMFALLHAETGFHSYGLAALTRILGLDPDEADKVCTGGLAATKDKKNHMYTKWWVYLLLAWGWG